MDAWRPRSAPPASEYAIERRADPKTGRIMLSNLANRIGGCIGAWGILAFAASTVRPSVNERASDALATSTLVTFVAAPMFFVSVSSFLLLARPYVALTPDGRFATVRNPIFVYLVDLSQVAGISVTGSGWPKLDFVNRRSLWIGLEQPFRPSRDYWSEDLDILQHRIYLVKSKGPELCAEPTTRMRSIMGGGLTLLLVGWTVYLMLFWYESFFG